MLDPQTAANLLVEKFDEVRRTQMAGLPLLNAKLEVEALGFREHDGRVLGVLITPWLMNLILLPNDTDDWIADEIGRKVPRRFPAGTYKFSVNEIDGIGRYQSHSMYSPMREFQSQAHARAVAAAFLRDLMTPASADDADPVDEELLGRIMRGEDTPELESLLDAPAVADSPEAAPPADDPPSRVPLAERKLSRRDLLRGILPKH